MEGARGPIDHPAGGVDRRRVLIAAGLGAVAPILAPAVRWAGAAPREARRGNDLDHDLRTMMRGDHVPGLAACIVEDGTVTWSHGYGHANLAHDRPATPDTIFMLASISKTVMAVAVMQAVEDGLLDLDADVNDALPFDVRNPRHPDTAITLRLLLTHTSSIRDDWPTIVPFYANGDSPIALGDYLRRYLKPDGDLYHAHRSYSAWLPGARYDYCNIAAALAGYLVESASGIPFDAWCDERILRRSRCTGRAGTWPDSTGHRSRCRTGSGRGGSCTDSTATPTIPTASSGRALDSSRTTCSRSWAAASTRGRASCRAPPSRRCGACSSPAWRTARG